MRRAMHPVREPVTDSPVPGTVDSSRTRFGLVRTVEATALAVTLVCAFGLQPAAAARLTLKQWAAKDGPKLVKMLHDGGKALEKSTGKACLALEVDTETTGPEPPLSSAATLWSTITSDLGNEAGDCLNVEGGGSSLAKTQLIVDAAAAAVHAEKLKRVLAAHHVSIKGLGLGVVVPKTQSTTPTTSAEAHVGDPLTGDGYTVTLEQVIDPASGSNEFETPDAGTRFVAAQIQIVDSGSSAISGDANSDVVLLGSDDQDYTPVFDSLSACTNFDNGEFQLSPSASVTGCVAFQLPNGVTTSEVTFSTNGGFGGGEGIWHVP